MFFATFGGFKRRQIHKSLTQSLYPQSKPTCKFLWV